VGETWRLPRPSVVQIPPATVENEINYSFFQFDAKLLSLSAAMDWAKIGKLWLIESRIALLITATGLHEAIY